MQLHHPTTPSPSTEKEFDNLRKPTLKRRVVWGVLCAVGILIMILMMTLMPLLTREASQDMVIKIPRGATGEMVADSLTRHLGESYSRLVMRIAKFRHTDFSQRHGAYLIPAGTSPLRAERRLSQGAQHPVKVTLNNSRSMTAVGEKVANRLDLTSGELEKYMATSEELRSRGLTPEQALALYIDDTYEFYWSASPEDIAHKMGQNYDRVWNEERRAKASRLGLTPVEVMTVCSIVDEETNKTDEKGKIGRLYINRLHKGMLLQADPTVKFALGDFSLRRIRGNHLKVESPYNTYKNKGLPPGPIRTTSTKTIDEVLNSEPSEFIYMCAKEDFSGYHNFAADYATHMENARRYQKALNERNIH